MLKIVPDADHPNRRECPMCDYITLVPAEDEHSEMWSCVNCGAEVQFGATTINRKIEMTDELRELFISQGYDLED